MKNPAITRAKLIAKGACQSGVSWFDAKFPPGGDKYNVVVESLNADGHTDWARWLRGNFNPAAAIPEPVTPDSAVIRLLDLVWEKAQAATSHSYGRLNTTMRHALELAIRGGFQFEVNDFTWIFSHYRSSYWMGESSEWCFSAAVAENNLSAANSFEVNKRRPAFIADNVAISDHNSFAHMVGDRQTERLHVGASFKWQGQKVEVTSFADDGSHVVACSYERTDEFRRKIKKRFKITRDDIIADRAERKKRAAIMVELKKLMAAKAFTQAELIDRLGVKGLPSANVECDAMPVKQLAEVLAWAKEKANEPA